MGNTAAKARDEASNRRTKASKGTAGAPKGGAEEIKGGVEESKGEARPSKGGAREPEVVTAPSRADAYTINFTNENRIGGGQYADVYKIQKKNT
jgi:hypothetical protein